MSIEQRTCPAEQRSTGSAAAEPVGVSLRCGRRLPEVHLIELTDAVEHRYHLRRTLVTVCGATDVPELARPDPDSEDPDSEDCPGCADCLRYCRECVEAAMDWVARTDRRG